MNMYILIGDSKIEWHVYFFINQLDKNNLFDKYIQ
jgi:hypothetical protein